MSKDYCVNNIPISELEEIYLPKAKELLESIKPHLLDKVSSQDDLSILKKEVVALMMCLVSDRFNVVKSYTDGLENATEELKISLFYETLQDNIDGFFIHPEFCCFFDYPL
jgi:hypothetical protein